MLQQRAFDEGLPTCEAPRESGWSNVASCDAIPTSKVDSERDGTQRLTVCGLSAGVVDLWSIRLREPAAHRLAGTAFDEAADDDRSAAARFRDEHAQALFMAGRQAQRDILSRYVSQSPNEIRIDRPAQGKPVLGHHSQLHFSFSRRGAHALMAVATVPVGVDLELPRSGWHARELMAVIGSAAERERVAALPATHQADAVMRCWTAKEACVKATGWGLALAPHRFEVGPLLADVSAPAWELSLPSLTAGELQRWSVQSLEMPAGATAALAVRVAEPPAPMRIVRRQWGA